jgi:hypothetical protein
MLLAFVLEPLAITDACGPITINNALSLFFGVRALRPAGIRICPATRLAGIGLAEFIRFGAIGRRGLSGACHDQRAEQTSGEQQGFHGNSSSAGSQKVSNFF